MSGADLVTYAANAALILFSLALLLTAARIILGPTLPDRIVALDLLVGEIIGFIAAFALRTGVASYIDIAIAIGLVGFLATVAFARYVTGRRCADNRISARQGVER